MGIARFLHRSLPLRKGMKRIFGERWAEGPNIETLEAGKTKDSAWYLRRYKRTDIIRSCCIFRQTKSALFSRRSASNRIDCFKSSSQ